MLAGLHVQANAQDHKQKITMEIHSKCVNTLNRGPMSEWEADLNKQICGCASKRFVERYYPFNDDQRPLDAYKKIVKQCNTEALFRAAEESKS
jgi:hypothetical protein